MGFVDVAVGITNEMVRVCSMDVDGIDRTCCLLL